jgi:MFS family permease
MTTAAPLAGRLADQLGTRGLVVAGLVLEAAGLWAIGTAGAQTPIPALAFAFAATGFGLGLF